MTSSTNGARLAYTGAGLDRGTLVRADNAEIDRLLADPSTGFLATRDDGNFVPDGALEGTRDIALRLDAERFDALTADGEIRPVFLGTEGPGALFALDTSTLPEAIVTGALGPGAFLNLRDITARLAAPDAARLAYARALMYWHRTHRFCPNCGSATRPQRAGHVRTCTNAACKREHYPHLNPAVIMLVSTVGPDGVARALLGRHGGLPAGMYSTLAGFIEPGESLEEAVAREVSEEAGIRVENVRYFASQPWPFPAGIMLGFHADAASHDIALNDAELDDARWFSADDVATFGEWGDESTGFRIPRRDSIARALIEAWLATVRRER
ncbi:MAG: hypothetical protein NVSMB5_19210 [Candidatus Velthaea sp.]